MASCCAVVAALVTVTVIVCPIITDAQAIPVDRPTIDKLSVQLEILRHKHSQLAERLERVVYLVNSKLQKKVHEHQHHEQEQSKLPELHGCQVKGKLYKVGDTWTDLGECERNTCLTGGVIKTETCPELPPSSKVPGCHKVPMDLNKPFPDCCPKYVCTSSSSTSILT